MHDLGVILMLLGVVQVFMAFAWRGADFGSGWSDDDLASVLEKQRGAEPGQAIPITNREMAALLAHFKEGR